MAEDLKFIRQELYEAYEMNDRILVGYALNRLDTYIKEQKEAEEQKETSPAFSNVMRSLQEKKKLWENNLRIDKEAQIKDNAKYGGDMHNFYAGCIQRDEKILVTLEEIINQNFA